MSKTLTTMSKIAPIIVIISLTSFLSRDAKASFCNRMLGGTEVSQEGSRVVEKKYVLGGKLVSEKITSSNEEGIRSRLENVYKNGNLVSTYQLLPQHDRAMERIYSGKTFSDVLHGDKVFPEAEQIKIFNGKGEIISECQVSGYANEIVGPIQLNGESILYTDHKVPAIRLNFKQGFLASGEWLLAQTSFQAADGTKYQIDNSPGTEIQDVDPVKALSSQHEYINREVRVAIKTSKRIVYAGRAFNSLISQAQETGSWNLNERNQIVPNQNETYPDHSGRK